MALMVRYCEAHRHAFAVSADWRKGPCPAALAAADFETEECPVRSVDAIAQINALGEELFERDRDPEDS